MTPSTPRGSSEASTTPAVSMPTSARASAGASLTPSPTIATRRPRRCRSATTASLSSGRTSANTSSMPRSAATASATWRASPVSITTRLPSRWSSWTAWRDSGRTASSSARAPSTSPSRATYSTVAPRRRHWSSWPASASGSRSPSSRSRAGPPTAAVTPSTLAVTPRPVIERKSPACGRSPRSRAAATIARASGCSLSASAAPASRSSPSASPSTAATPVTAGSPVVRVPVLSNRTASTVRIRSSASRSVTRIPLRALSAVEMAITSGIARPSACGQAITSTVTVRSTALPGSPRSNQAAKVTTPTPTANQNSSAAARSASAWARERDACARSTSRRMPASAVASPTAPTRTRIAESAINDPATTRSPTDLATGLDSPVIGDHRLVQLGGAVHHHAVGRHPPAGADQHQVADVQLGGRDGPGAAVVDQLGVVGQQRRQVVQGAGGLPEGAHLQPVPEQHDHDQQRQLPPEVQVEEAERGGGTGHEGDPDRQGDQQHHAGLAAACLRDAALQERPAAVQEHHRAEHWRDPLRARELRRGEAQPLLDHLGVGDHREGEDQAQPEAVAELGGVVPMPAVTAVALVPAVRLVPGVVLGAGVRGHAPPFPSARVLAVATVPPWGIGHNRAGRARSWEARRGRPAPAAEPGHGDTAPPGGPSGATSPKFPTHPRRLSNVPGPSRTQQ